MDFGVANPSFYVLNFNKESEPNSENYKPENVLVWVIDESVDWMRHRMQNLVGRQTAALCIIRYQSSSNLHWVTVSPFLR